MSYRVNGNNLQVQGYMANGEKGTWTVDRFPDECPSCKMGSEFQPLYSFYKAVVDDPWEIDSERLQVMFRCPRLKCQVLFFGIYTGTYLHLNACGIIEYVKPQTFPEPIPTISKRFIGVFRQSQTAEENRLNEICGAGYGKALEILIKDYLIYLYPDRANEIKINKKLGKLIDEFQDAEMETVADRGAWLRNDEVHYEKDWKEEDVTSLKELIELTVMHIKRAEMTKKYKEKMADPREARKDSEKPSN